MLAATLISAGAASVTGQALNDVVLQKWQTGRMLDFETWIDGRYVNTHGGDGLVVATATGSTAYALQLRRPDPLSGARCAGARADLSAHAVRPADRGPQLLADEVRLLERPDTQAQVTCDGVSLGELAPGRQARDRARRPPA